MDKMSNVYDVVKVYFSDHIEVLGDPFDIISGVNFIKSPHLYFFPQGIFDKFPVKLVLFSSAGGILEGFPGVGDTSTIWNNLPNLLSEEQFLEEEDIYQKVYDALMENFSDNFGNIKVPRIYFGYHDSNYFDAVN